MEEPEYDKVTQASLNGIYVKAQEMDRGHNEVPAPSFLPPGAAGDAESHASTHASDAGGGSSAQAADVETHASTHASDAGDGTSRCAVDAASSPSASVDGARESQVALAGDAEAHVSTHASDGA